MWWLQRARGTVAQAPSMVAEGARLGPSRAVLPWCHQWRGVHSAARAPLAAAWGRHNARTLTSAPPSFSACSHLARGRPAAERALHQPRSAAAVCEPQCGPRRRAVARDRSHASLAARSMTTRCSPAAHRRCSQRVRRKGASDKKKANSNCDKTTPPPRRHLLARAPPPRSCYGSIVCAARLAPAALARRCICSGSCRRRICCRCRRRCRAPRRERVAAAARRARAVAQRRGGQLRHGRARSESHGRERRRCSVRWGYERRGAARSARQAQRERRSCS